MFFGRALTTGERQKAAILALAFVGMVLFLLIVPGSGADGIIRCPFRWLTGFSCPGCGMTRACTHAIHGNVWTSLQFHPMGIPFVVGFALTAAWNAVQAVTNRQLLVGFAVRNPGWVKAFWWGILLFLLSYGVIRLVLEIAGILTPV